MSSPYRESALIPCPRCDEVLEELPRDMATCTRCDGFWISKRAAAEMFEQLRWPSGISSWWRDELRCPTCAAEAVQTIMSARTIDGVIVDQCAKHGTWLDAGELARVMDSRSDDLVALRHRIAISAADVETIVARRKGRRDEQELRRAAADSYRRAQNTTVEQEEADEREREAARKRAEKEAERAERARLADAAQTRSQLAMEIEHLGERLAGETARRDELRAQLAAEQRRTEHLSAKVRESVDEAHRFERAIASNADDVLHVQSLLESARGRLALLG